MDQPSPPPSLLPSLPSPHHHHRHHPPPPHHHHHHHSHHRHHHPPHHHHRHHHHPPPTPHHHSHGFGCKEWQEQWRDGHRMPPMLLLQFKVTGWGFTLRVFWFFKLSDVILIGVSFLIQIGSSSGVSSLYIRGLSLKLGRWWFLFESNGRKWSGGVRGWALGQQTIKAMAADCHDWNNNAFGAFKRIKQISIRRNKGKNSRGRAIDIKGHVSKLPPAPSILENQNREAYKQSKEQTSKQTNKQQKTFLLL